MSTLVQKLQTVHDNLTDLMTVSKLDVPTRREIADAVKQISEAKTELAAAEAAQAEQALNASRPKKRTLVERAMILLAKVAALVEQLMKRGYDDGS